MAHFTPKNEELCLEPTVITFKAKSGTSPTVQAEEGLDGRWKREDGSNCPPLWGRREKTEKNLGRMENQMRFPKQFLFDIIRKWGHELGPDLLTMKLMDR